ncbi:MAG: glycoside hydrolase family 3 C-terminal domain-containing protein [Candidatus Nanopelagicales bacterium]
MTTFDVAQLISELTLEEKASLCQGSDFWHTAGVERLGIPRITLSDGPHGLRMQPDEADHVGISGSLPATCFPTASALSSSWDVELVHRVGEAIGREARTQGVDVVLGPGINIKRSPLCGRNFEYVSEDPLLSGALGAAMVDGIQSVGVGTSLKHYAVNNQETDRLRVSADVDERPLREIYLKGFEHVIRHAQPWTVMCAYNKVNGTYASQHRWLLTDLLRDEWGFEGVVVSDWGAVDDRVAAVAAGLDLEMPPNLAESAARIVAAVGAGTLDHAVVDLAATRMLQLVERSQQKAGIVVADMDDHHRIAREAARDSAVLLRNVENILPLHLSPTSRLAVVGEFARTARYQGAGSSQVNPTRLDIALDEIRRLAPEGAEVTFSPGFGIVPSDVDEALRAEAVVAADDADTVVVFLGLPASAESEGFDRSHMELPANQLELLDAIAAVNERVVVVLANGSAVRVADWKDRTSAILECWLSGQAAGGAAADLLLGIAAPSGRLAETLPLRLEDSSSFLNFPGDSGHVRYGEGIFVGYRGYDAAGQEVSYPFGHGLTYTTFDYADLAVDLAGSYTGGDLSVSATVRVTNTGSLAGKEVVQLYVRALESSVARPVRELMAFAKVSLEPGESRTVPLMLDGSAFAYWSVVAHDWVVESGRFEIAVGRSSRDLPLRREVVIVGSDLRVPITADSTLEEWLADPTAAAALRAAFGTNPDGSPAGLLADEDLLTVIGNFPLSRLAAFPGMGIDRATIDVLLKELGG